MRAAERLADARALLGEIRADLASGDTERVIRWVQNDGAFDVIADALDRVEKLERVRKKILADHHVREAFRVVDHARRIKGTPEWWDFRDNIPEGAFVDIDVLNELRDLDSTPEATHG